MNVRIELCLAALLCVCGCGGESQQARLKRFHREADETLQRRCQEIVGFRRIIEKSIHDVGDNPAQWTAEAQIEFINVSGGVSATNLPYYFRQSASVDNVAHVHCFTDEKKLPGRYQQAYDEATKKLRKLSNIEP